MKRLNPLKMSLFIFKQKVGSLVFGKGKVIIRQPKKMFRLCTRDEYGTRTLAKPRVILKSTALWHEKELRTERWRHALGISTYDATSWAAYQENIETIDRLADTLDNALTKYKERRLQAGLFYFVPDSENVTFLACSYLHGGRNSNFLKHLWRKKRLEHEMKVTTKETIALGTDLSDINRVSVVAGTLRLCDMRHLFCMLLVLSLALAIVYM
jgi:hypothetical protein